MYSTDFIKNRKLFWARSLSVCIHYVTIQGAYFCSDILSSSRLPRYVPEGSND